MSGLGSEETLEGAAPTTQPFGQGSRVGGGRYTIKRFVAGGGMGEVYEAEDLVVGGRVALKTLRGDRTSSMAMQRFRREIALARKVTHPNVCRVHDVGEHDGTVFLTMELLDGETLTARIRRDGPLPEPELDRIARQLVSGLAALHAAGVVHRDFKSSNIMLAGDRVVITDFGLARHETPESSDQLTADGAMLGTPAYMAPEQVKGVEATSASDLYALGIVLYEMATGELPFRGDTPLAMASARLHETPARPVKRRSDLSPAWDSAIMRCLAREPQARPRATDVLPAVTRRRVPWWLVAVMLALVLALGAIATVLVVRRTPTAALDPRTRVVRHIEVKEFEAARALLEPMVVERPDDPWIHYRLAVALWGLGEDDLGNKHYSLAYDRRSALDEADRIRTEIGERLHAKDMTAVFALYDRLATLAPNDVIDGINRVWLLSENRHAEAIAALAALRSAHPGDPRIDLAESVLVMEGDQARGRELAQRALSKATALDAPLLEAEALRGLAWSDANLGNLARAEEEAAGAHRRYAAAGHRRDVLNSLNSLALVQWTRGRYRESVTSLKTAIDLSPGAKPAGHLVLNQAIGRTYVGDAAAAFAEIRDLEAPNSVDLTAQGTVAARAGESTRARELFDASRKRLLPGDLFSAVFLDWQSGILYAQVGDRVAARRELEAAIGASARAGMLSMGSQARIALAEVALAEGDHRSAEALARQGLAEQRAHGSVASVGFALAVIAKARLAAGDPAGAKAALKEASEVRSSLQDPLELAAIDSVRVP